MSKYHSTIHYTIEYFFEQNIEKRNNRIFILECLRHNGLIFEHIEAKFQTDDELALTAIEQDDEVWSMLPIELIEDSNFLEKLIGIRPLLIIELKNEYPNLINKSLILIAIEKIGVDALWEMNSEIFKDINIIVSALKSPYGQDCWESILCAAGENAEYSKKIIEAGYNLYGDKVLEFNYEKLLNNQELVEMVKI